MEVETRKRKTETIKDRAIYVYLPSLEMVEDWKARAEKGGVSISNFVIERVEDSIRREEGFGTLIQKDGWRICLNRQIFGKPVPLKRPITLKKPVMPEITVDEEGHMREAVGIL